MRLVRSRVSVKDFDTERWNAVAGHLRADKGGLGDLGGGNHFLDALAPYDDGPVYFLIHTGSRSELSVPLTSTKHSIKLSNGQPTTARPFMIGWRKFSARLTLS
jgi:hypothetical protein